MHYGVEVVADQAGGQFKRWIGGHYEHMFSCNPIWEPSFTHFPDHPITRGVEPFTIKDEWYFNMRFVTDMAGNQPATIDGLQFVPILVATPSDAVRDGPYAGLYRGAFSRQLGQRPVPQSRSQRVGLAGQSRNPRHRRGLQRDLSRPGHASRPQIGCGRASYR